MHILHLIRNKGHRNLDQHLSTSLPWTLLLINILSYSNIRQIIDQILERGVWHNKLPTKLNLFYLKVLEHQIQLSDIRISFES